MQVAYESVPELVRPVLLVAFQGWNDAGEAASTAVRSLGEAVGAEPFARIDPEDLYDFQVNRPHVRVDADGTRRIVWPEVAFSAASVGDRDVVLLEAPEPALRWRAFCDTVIEVCRRVGVEFAVTLGALLADVPHTRPVRVFGSAHSRELAEQLGLAVSRYEGPTGIVGVLGDALRRARIPAASLWAAVPHYASQIDSPKAALELVARLGTLLDAPIEVPGLDKAAGEYREQVEALLQDEPQTRAYVRELELSFDADAEADVSGDRIAEEAERFLRELRDD